MQQPCFLQGTVEQKFLQPILPLRGNSRMDRVPHIGEYLRTRLANQLNAQGQGIVTVNDFLRRASNPANMSEAKMRRFIAGLMVNARANTCVPSHRGQHEFYHVSDVNVCGYNALVALIHFANQHQNDFANFGLAQAFPFGFANRLQYRNRGTNPGARHCSCRSTSASCTAPDANNECTWYDNRVCIPSGPQQPGAGFSSTVGQNFRRPDQFTNSIVSPDTRQRNGPAAAQWLQPGQGPLVGLAGGHLTSKTQCSIKHRGRHSHKRTKRPKLRHTLCFSTKPKHAEPNRTKANCTKANCTKANHIKAKHIKAKHIKRTKAKHIKANHTKAKHIKRTKRTKVICTNTKKHTRTQANTKRRSNTRKSMS